MNPKDFTFTSTASGYALSYKGQPIGGAGTTSSERKHPSASKADRDLFARSARMEIAKLIEGYGPRYMRDHIEQINQQQHSALH